MAAKKPRRPAHEADDRQAGARVRKPHHKPAPETRAQVEALSGYGIRQDEISAYLDIDAKTLRKHYRKELDHGKTKANVSVARSLHKQALEGNVAAAIFWLKAQAGWREKSELEVSMPGAPVVNLILQRGDKAGG
jgi:hypothetical protein